MCFEVCVQRVHQCPDLSILGTITGCPLGSMFFFCVFLPLPLVVMCVERVSAVLFVPTSFLQKRSLSIGLRPPLYFVLWYASKFTCMLLSSMGQEDHNFLFFFIFFLRNQMAFFFFFCKLPHRKTSWRFIRANIIPISLGLTKSLCIMVYIYTNHSYVIWIKVQYNFFFVCFLYLPRNHAGKKKLESSHAVFFIVC